MAHSIIMWLVAHEHVILLPFDSLPTASTEHGSRWEFTSIMCESHCYSTAISTFTSVSSLSSDGLRMRACMYSTGIVWNELIRGYANILHTLSSFHPHTHAGTHTHTLSYHLRTTNWKAKSGLGAGHCLFNQLHSIFRRQKVTDFLMLHQPCWCHWEYLKGNYLLNRGNCPTVPHTKVICACLQVGNVPAKCKAAGSW